MSTEVRHITVNGMRVEIVGKAIKNLHLGVYPPHGRVRVAAPVAVNDDAVRLAVITRLPWIKRRQAGFAKQDRQSPREYVSGESHYLWGRRYRLAVVEQPGLMRLSFKNAQTIVLNVRPECHLTQRERVFLAWYRQEIKAALPPLIEKWSRLIGVRSPRWGIKRMKTKWGSCSINAKRIWLNLELAKKPPQCLEYIIVHELSHLIERHHNERFVKLLDRHLPQWRTVRAELNAAPLRHEEWQFQSSKRGQL
jgi:predicted metal-dependent hydrolase